MRIPHVLSPALDALAPAEPGAEDARIRVGALWMTLAPWLLPDWAGLGTDTLPHRAWISGAFAVVVATVSFRSKHAWAKRAFPVACALVATLVFWFGHGALWGLVFGLLAAAVIGLSEARRRWVETDLEPREHDPLVPRPNFAARVMTGYASMGLWILLVVEFSGQAMVVPTGSMEPTIMGAAGGSAGAMTKERSGDHLVVDRTRFLYRDPRRFEIVVFRFPLFRERFFVKRVVGLPGEHIELIDGDLWVNGKIARKPRVVQHTMWQEMFPRTSPLSSPAKLNEKFQAAGDWKPETPTSRLVTPGAAEPSLAFYRDKAGSDLRLAFTATARSDATSAIVRITSRGTPVTLTVPVTGAGSFAVGKETKPLAANLHGPTRVELCVADGAAWALVDGAEVASAELPPDRRGANRAEFGFAGGPGSAGDVWLGRDIRYEARTKVSAWDVPADGFFFIGDNDKAAQGSYDSRMWAVEVFHPPGGAPPLAAKVTTLNEVGGDVRNVRQEDGNWRFLDVDGVPRSIPVAGTTLEHEVPAPFARRADLVGKPVLVIWPLFPQDAGFRPRLLP